MIMIMVTVRIINMIIAPASEWPLIDLDHDHGDYDYYDNYHDKDTINFLSTNER